jgi:clan AA aspartic protease (TIGR02281 family)
VKVNILATFDNRKQYKCREKILRMKILKNLAVSALGILPPVAYAQQPPSPLAESSVRLSKEVHLPPGLTLTDLIGKQTSISPTTVKLTANMNGQFFLIAKVNNINFAFMVDTGATSVMLSQDNANRLGVDASKLPQKQMFVANGKSPVSKFVLNSVEVGSCKLPHVDAALVTGMHKGLGLFGMSALRRFDVNISHDVMTISCDEAQRPKQPRQRSSLTPKQ